MKIINNTGNTIYIDDIDFYLPFQDGLPQEVSPDLLKRSRCLRGFIFNGLLEVAEFDDKERIESAIMFNKRQLAKTSTPLPQIETPQEDIEPESLINCQDEIEVKIHGIFFDAGGYAKVNRNIALKLKHAGLKVKVDPKRSINQLNEKELQPIIEMQKTTLSRNHILIDSVIPSFGEMSSGKYKILYTTIESYSLPKQFLECCKAYQEIWLTSEWSADILRRELKDKPVYAIITGADHELYTEHGTRFKLQPNVKDFVFVSVFGWNYRKGYDVLLRAYFDEFSEADNVSLLIVSRYQSNQSKFHKNRIKTDIEEIMKEFPNKDLPHVVRYSNITPETDMPKLYRACNCFVLPSRGEGGCTLSGTKIITQDGLASIESIGQGTNVLTHMGRWRMVTQTRERFTEETMFEIKTTLNSDTINLTGEHPVFVLKHRETLNYGKKNKAKFQRNNCQWLPPDKIEPGDYLVMPLNFGNTKPLDYINTKLFLKNILVENKQIYRKVTNQYNAIFKHTNIKTVPKYITLTDDVLQFIGFYISEGCSKTNGGQVTFSFHSSETEYHALIERVLLNVFNTRAKIVQYHDDRVYRHTISCDNSLLNELLATMCGRGSHNKKMPPFFTQLNPQQIKSLLYGIFSGDGCFYNPGSSPSLTLSTTSEQLADEVMLALRMIGFSGCKQNKKRRGFTVTVKGDQLNDLKIKGCKFDGIRKERSIRSGNYLFLPVKEIIQYNYRGFVYNLEIDEDESYTTNCFTVHNCLTPIEASLCGLPVIMTNCSGQQGYIRADNCYPIEIDYLTEIKPGQMHLHYWDGQKFPALTSPEVHNSLRKAMRHVIENPAEAKAKNKKMQELILQNFTWNNTANQAIERLREINKKLKGE